MNPKTLTDAESALHAVSVEQRRKERLQADPIRDAIEGERLRMVKEAKQCQMFDELVKSYEQLFDLYVDEVEENDNRIVVETIIFDHQERIRRASKLL